MQYFYAENKNLENRIDRFFSYISDANIRQFSGQISVLLLGSLSRGEATWMTRDGQDVLLSDIEFLSVYREGFRDFDRFAQVVRDAADAAFADCGSALFHIDNALVSQRRVRALERKLLTFDAQEMGVTVVGEDVKSLLPHIDLTNINLEDIHDILLHRVFSVLFYGADMRHDEDCVEYRYLLAKNSLDLMTVLLAENGILVSGFGNRLRQIEKLPVAEELKDYFRYCLAVKLGQTPEKVIPIADMEKRFITLVCDLDAHFSIPLKNRLVNLKAITRRRLGALKRALRGGHIPGTRKRHLGNLISIYRNGSGLKEKNLLDNWVLNGYPNR